MQRWKQVRFSDETKILKRKRRPRLYQVLLVGTGFPMITKIQKKVKKYKKRKRTAKTLENKLRRLKSKYNKLIKGEKFKSKYSSFEQFLEKLSLKKFE